MPGGRPKKYATETERLESRRETFRKATAKYEGRQRHEPYIVFGAADIQDDETAAIQQDSGVVPDTYNPQIDDDMPHFKSSSGRASPAMESSADDARRRSNTHQASESVRRAVLIFKLFQTTTLSKALERASK
jgi:hypothetical protein